MRVGSLCTGYGGIEMGLSLAGVDVDLRWLAEVDPALAPLHGDTPNLGDISLVDWSAGVVERVDLITAGFPCQPVSAAGRQRGEADERWLWPHVQRAIAELRPRRVFLENVRNLVSTQKGALWAGILADLGSLGYGVRWLTLGACHVGAAHHRHRVFALATMGDRGVERVATTPCGAKGGDALPTPAASAYGSNQGGAAGRVGPVRHSLDGLARRDLLPTPNARDGNARGAGSAEYWATHQAGDDKRHFPLASAVTLLPSPSASDAGSGGRIPASNTVDERGQRVSRTTGNAHALPLASITALLPTPWASDGANGGPSQRGSSGDLAMPSAVQPEHWGRFAEAVVRHESIYGPAPAPTEPNRNGAPRLAPAFAEWLMCLPAGHVTTKLARVPALRAIGNGVCPPQAAAAWRLLTDTASALDTSLGLRLASLDMTASGETKIDSSGDEIRQRRAEQQRRVMAAATDPLIIGAETNPALIETALRVALMNLAGEWRDEAAWWDGVKRRGSVGAARELREAATRVAAFAQGLSVEPPPRLAPTQRVYARCDLDFLHEAHEWLDAEKIPQWCDGGDLDESVPLGIATPQPTGDALMDFFTGAAPTYTPPARPEQVLAALPKAEPMVTLSVNTMTTAALGLVDSPFTSPGRPGVNRPAVARLGYAALPAVARVLGEQDAREHVSHSFVDSYESCSLSALLNDASRAELIGPRRPSWSLVGGNAFHSAVESIEQAAAAGTVPDSVHVSVWEKHLSTQIQDLCADLSGSAYADPSSWHVANGGREGFDWWRVEGAKMLDVYLRHHDAQWRETHRILMIDGKPCLEQPYEMTVRSPDGTTGRTAKGFIDAAWVDLTTNLIVLSDYKTGRSAPATTFQLGEYAHALALLLGVEGQGVFMHGAFPGYSSASSIHARYWLARRGEYTPQIDPIKAHPLGELQYRYDMAMRGMEAGVFAPHVSNLCVSCGVADYCPARASSEN